MKLKIGVVRRLNYKDYLAALGDHIGGNTERKTAPLRGERFFIYDSLQKQAFDGAENKKPITSVTGFSFCG